MKKFRGIAKDYYQIATYIKPEYFEKFGSRIQEATREAIQRVLTMKEEDIIAVSKEVVEEELKNAFWKIIYVDKELYERWRTIPKSVKKWLHYWINQMLEKIELDEKRVKKPSYFLPFYLFGRISELYKQGLLNGEIILSVLQELKEHPDEIKPWGIREFEYKKWKLGEAVKVSLNFKHHPELRDWYADLSIELKRGVWIKTNEKLLDKLQNLWYNILHQNS
jgi:hypothetical protein